MSLPADAKDWPFGIAPNAYARLQALFDKTPGLARVWLYGSRARGDHRPASDIDLAVEWQDADEPWHLSAALEELELIYRTDLVSLDKTLNAEFRQRIERDRKVFWEPRRASVSAASVGAVQMKKFQDETLKQLDGYLAELKKNKTQSDAAQAALRVMEGMEDLLHEAADFPKKTWAALKAQGQLPPTFANQPHSSRFDGAGRAIPNVCLKIPTGGGKTLLAAASVGRVLDRKSVV